MPWYGSPTPERWAVGPIVISAVIETLCDAVPHGNTKAMGSMRVAYRSSNATPNTPDRRTAILLLCAFLFPLGVLLFLPAFVFIGSGSLRLDVFCILAPLVVVCGYLVVYLFKQKVTNAFLLAERGRTITGRVIKHERAHKPMYVPGMSMTMRSVLDVTIEITIDGKLQTIMKEVPIQWDKHILHLDSVSFRYLPSDSTISRIERP